MQNELLPHRVQRINATYRGDKINSLLATAQSQSGAVLLFSGCNDSPLLKQGVGNQLQRARAYTIEFG